MPRPSLRTDAGSARIGAPGRWLRRGAVALLLLLAGRARAVDDVMRVHFIDVGQGAATLVEFPCAAILIDSGGERWPEDEALPARYDSTKALLAYLRAFFDRRADLHEQLALLILTHPHKDHTRGVPAVLAAFPPHSVVSNGQSHGSGAAEQNQARAYASETGGVTSWYVLERKIDKATGMTNAAIDPVQCASTDPKIRVLWGQVRRDRTWDEAALDDENNHSVAVRIDYGAASLLITGDLEAAVRSPHSDPAAPLPAGIEHLVSAYAHSGLLDADVYEVGHHGSRNGTTPALLAAISPKIAVIEAGPACQRDGFSAWHHGHPNTRTIDELAAAVSDTRPPKSVTVFSRPGTPVKRAVTKAIYSTGWDGTIVLQARPDGAWSVVETTGPNACVQH